VSQDPRHVPHKLYSALEMAAGLLDLPLDARQFDALAIELTGPVRALIAEALDTARDDSPVRYAVTAPHVDEQAGVETTEYAGCVNRIAVDVDHDSPAAVLAADLRRHHDVVATDVPTGAYLGLTVRPRTARAWQWWLRKLAIREDKVTVQGTNAYAVGEKDGVAVHLCGDDTALLLSAGTSVRRGLDVDLDTPAGTVAAKARRQPDVTAIEIRDAHTIAITVRATSLLEWQWWINQISADPNSVGFEGATAFITGSKDGATVELHGDGCRAFYTEDVAGAWLMGLVTAATTAKA
jgi:hypothetical protein